MGTPAQILMNDSAELLDEQGLTPAQRVFLEAYPVHKTIKDTCNAIQLNPSTVRAWAEEGNDTPFGRAFRVAKDDVGDLVEGEMLRRAMAGVSPMSDTLLIFATKRHKPEYREKYEVAHSGTVTNVHLVAELPTSDRLALLQMALEHESRALPPPSTEGE